jgi:BirA family biotin operon repressor/biotin-[acetyl-CoA-carboxylase] ligase
MKFEIRRLTTCSSTNDVAKELVRQGAPEGTVVVSEEQTAGRGTKGRTWHSACGKGLYVSLVLRPETPEITLLPLAAGLAVLEALERTESLSARLRWPNDIVWGGKKLGGILCESGFLGNRSDYVILGIGLNVSHEEGDFPEDLRSIAVSMRMAIRGEVDVESLLRHLLRGVERWYEIFTRGECGRIKSAFERHSAFRKGDPVIVMTNDKPVQGVYQGIDISGGLLIEDNTGLRRFTSAEIMNVI